MQNDQFKLTSPQCIHDFDQTVAVLTETAVLCFVLQMLSEHKQNNFTVHNSELPFMFAYFCRHTLEYSQGNNLLSFCNLVYS